MRRNTIFKSTQFRTQKYGIESMAYLAPNISPLYLISNDIKHSVTLNFNRKNKNKNRNKNKNKKTNKNNNNNINKILKNFAKCKFPTLTIFRIYKIECKYLYTGFYLGQVFRCV